MDENLGFRKCSGFKEEERWPKRPLNQSGKSYGANLFGKKSDSRASSNNHWTRVAQQSNQDAGIEKRKGHIQRIPVITERQSFKKK